MRAFILPTLAATRSKSARCSAVSLGAASCMSRSVNPAMARSGARRSWEIEYENDSSCRFAASSSEVRFATLCSSSSLSLWMASSDRMRSVMSRTTSSAWSPDRGTVRFSKIRSASPTLSWYSNVTNDLDRKAWSMDCIAGSAIAGGSTFRTALPRNASGGAYRIDSSVE